MLEYLPTATTKPGNEWCVHEEKLFLNDYAIHKHDLSLWHEVMVGQGRFWQIARLRYRIGPIFLGEGAEDMDRPWSIMQIAERLAQPPATIEAELSQTWRYWQQQRAERKNESIMPIDSVVAPSQPVANPPAATAIASPTLSKEPTEVLPSFAIRKVEDTQADRMLAELGINVSDPAEKIYVASRAICFERWINDPLTREIALNIIHSEKTLRSYRRNLDKVVKLLDEKNLDASKRTDLMKEMRESEKSIRELFTAYHKAQDELGGEQSAVEDMKREAVNTLGFVTQAIAKFRSKGDTSLIDDVFTAREVVWLTTPVPMRSGQYRPDIVALIKDAMQPQNLFDEKYKPPHITREACRRLHRMQQIFEAECGVTDNRNTVVEAPAEADDEETSTGSSSITPSMPQVDSTVAPLSVLPYANTHRASNDADMISFISS